MTADSIFQFANTVAFLSWILLIGFGWKRWVREIVTGAAVPALLAFLYIVLIVSHWGQGKGDFSTLAGLESLFSNRWLLLAGWVHYLAFDLFIGSWEARNAARHGIAHWMVVPCLLATFFFGPLGLALYLTLRFALRRKFTITDGAGLSPRTY
jgi:hypothetical protein